MMSNRTKEINKITTTIISVSVKLIVYALIVLLLYEAVAKGYAFGHEVFYAEAVEEAPGRDVTIEIDKEETVSEAAGLLSKKGLIKNEFAFIFQGKFYDYDTVYPGAYVLNTSMTSKEILQVLNEKPKGEASPVQSGSAKAKTTAESFSAAAEPKSDLEAESAKAASEKTQDLPKASTQAFQSFEENENGAYYGDEDQEMEGGWIEEAPEDEPQ